MKTTILLFAFLGLAAGQTVQSYNTIKQKLAAGKQVVGGTVYISDPDTYCAMANAGFDYLLSSTLGS